MQFQGFDWDAGNRAKCCKHGLTIAEIEEVFARAPQIAPDTAHSGTEQRFVAVARGRAGRPIFVVFTLRERQGVIRVRPISARYMHLKEALRYERQGSETRPRDDH